LVMVIPSMYILVRYVRRLSLIRSYVISRPCGEWAIVLRPGRAPRLHPIEGITMRMHWWQSIRWRLALGLVSIVLLATIIMAVAAILTIAHYYSNEQNLGLAASADTSADDIGRNYAQHGVLSFPTGIRRPGLPSKGLIVDTHGENYLFLIFSQNNRLVNPTFNQLVALNPQNRLLWAEIIRNVRLGVHNKGNATVISVSEAVRKAQQGEVIPGEIGSRSLFGLVSRPFIAVPIRSGGVATSLVVGVLLMEPLPAANNTLPQFVSEPWQVVLRISIIVAILAALAAIFFARTITRPLSKVTEATRVLTSGDYSARVLTNAPGELGELAHNFNDMAAQLQRDVEELRKQELWRRELIMSITHDLATPLTAIAGLGEALVDGVNQSREDYEETGRVIVRETLRLRRLVKDLHMMAKVEAGALVPQRKPVRLAPLVDEVMAVFVTEFER